MTWVNVGLPGRAHPGRHATEILCAAVVCPEWRSISPGWIRSLRVMGPAAVVPKVSAGDRVWYSRFSSLAWTAALVGCLAAVVFCRLASFWGCTRACTCSWGVRVDCPPWRPLWTVRCGVPESVSNGAFTPDPREHLYPDGVAVDSWWTRPPGTAGEVQNVRRDARPRRARDGGVDALVGPQIRLFVLVRASRSEVLCDAKDSLAPLGIGAARHSVRLEHGSTARKPPTSHSGQMLGHCGHRRLFVARWRGV